MGLRRVRSVVVSALCIAGCNGCGTDKRDDLLSAIMAEPVVLIRGEVVEAGTAAPVEGALATVTFLRTAGAPRTVMGDCEGVATSPSYMVSGTGGRFEGRVGFFRGNLEACMFMVVDPPRSSRLKADTITRELRVAAGAVDTVYVRSLLR